MDRNTWILLAFVGGALLPFQTGLNGKVSKALGSSEWAATVSFFVGFSILLLFSLLKVGANPLSSWKQVPWYSWSGGIIGATYVLLSLLAFQRIGIALTFALVIAGQLVVAVLLDHFNILVAQQHPINLHRVAGIMLIIGGVLLVRR